MPQASKISPSFKRLDIMFLGLMVKSIHLTGTVGLTIVADSQIIAILPMGRGLMFGLETRLVSIMSGSQSTQGFI